MATLNPNAPSFVPGFGGSAAPSRNIDRATEAANESCDAPGYAAPDSEPVQREAREGATSPVAPGVQMPRGSVDVIATQARLIQVLACLSRERVLYIDCEGADLSKGSWRDGRQLEEGVEGAWPIHGQLCLMQIGTTAGQTFVLDIQELGCQAFDLGLRKFLEDPKVTKVVHDFRQDADALWHQFSVNVNGIYDCQLCDVFIRRLSDLQTKYVRGSAKLFQEYGIEIEKIPGYGLLTQEKKLEIHARFSEDRHLWERRPLPEDMVLYAKADILPLPRLHWALQQRLSMLTGDEYLAERMVAAGSAAYATHFVEQRRCCCRLCCRAEENARFDGHRVLMQMAWSFQQEPWVIQRLWRPEDEHPLPPPGPSRFYVNENDESVPLPT